MLQRIVGGLVLLLGLAAVLIPLQHSVPYPLTGRNLIVGMLALVTGVLLLRPKLPAALRWGALLASPFLLFLALYATLAELEEVVVLSGNAEESADLRLWIVDREDGAWVSMPRAKAEANLLVGNRADLVRQGEARCVAPALHEDRDTNDAVHRDRHEKYAVQRIATTLGIFGRSAADDVVALRLDPCP